MLWKFRIRETPNLRTNADRSTIFFLKKKKIIPEQLLVLRLCELVHKCTSPLIEHLPRLDLPWVQSGTRLYKSINKRTSPLLDYLPHVDDPFIQSRTTPCFRALRVGRWVHQFTSITSPMRGRSIYAIQNNSSFYGSMSWSTSAPVHQSNTSQAWTIHVCNSEQLLVFRALRVGRRVHQSTCRTPAEKLQFKDLAV